MIPNPWASFSSKYNSAYPIGDLSGFDLPFDLEIDVSQHSFRLGIDDVETALLRDAGKGAKGAGETRQLGAGTRQMTGAHRGGGG